MSIKPKKPEKGKSLGDLNPGLSAQWHPTKNGQLTPFDVSPGSQAKAWWKCPKGDDHEWNAVIADRNKGIGCAVCSNYKVVKSNCLETLNPELAKEWHPTKNEKLIPRDVHPGSSKKVWWKCPKGDDHEWQTVVYSRTGGKGCPICDGKKVVESNSLATLNPELAKQWHPTKNGKLTPHDVGPGSKKAVWWKCTRGSDHEWRNTLHTRVSQDLGCPICSNQKIVKSNCLATLDPQLAELWHPTKNNRLTPLDVGLGSGKQVWWKCLKGDDHEWKETVGAQAKKRKGCPICLGRKLVKSNSFAVLYPELAKQWHRTKNGKLTPNNFRPGSQKRIWWQCYKYPDHVWRTSISERTNGTSCPKCFPSTSAPELRIYCELATVFPMTEHRKKIQGNEVDVFIPELNFGIEYDGWYWHKDFEERDKRKNDGLKSEITLLRVREKGLNKISDIDIKLKTDKLSIDFIKKILQHILSDEKIDSSSYTERINGYLKQEDWVASKHFDKLQIDRNRIEYKKSISHLFPEVVMQWHPTRNHPLKPDHFTPGSHKEIWWQDHAGREWQEEICRMVVKARKRKNTDENQLSFFE